MRSAAWLTLAGFGVLAAIIGFGWQPLEAQPPASLSGSLLALSSDAPEGHQQVTVIDPKSLVMSVYHIDNASGVISLKSVRNIRADLMMDEFNTDSPLPREIRAILTNR